MFLPPNEQDVQGEQNAPSPRVGTPVAPWRVFAFAPERPLAVETTCAFSVNLHPPTALSTGGTAMVRIASSSIPESGGQ